MLLGQPVLPLLLLDHVARARRKRPSQETPHLPCFCSSQRADVHRPPGLTTEGRDQALWHVCNVEVVWQCSRLSVEGNPGEPPGGGSPEQPGLPFLTQHDLSSTGRLFVFEAHVGRIHRLLHTSDVCTHKCTHRQDSQEDHPPALDITTCPSRITAL